MSATVSVKEAAERLGGSASMSSSMEATQISAHVGRLTCQVCQEAFTSKLDADIHKSLAHDLRRGGTDRTRRFLACRGCNERVFVGDRCRCGVVAVIPDLG